MICVRHWAPALEAGYFEDDRRMGLGCFDGRGDLSGLVSVRRSDSPHTLYTLWFTLWGSVAVRWYFACHPSKHCGIVGDGNGVSDQLTIESLN